MSKTESPVSADVTTSNDAARKIVENDHDIFLRGLLSIMVLVLKKLKYTLPSYLQVYTKLETLRPAPETHVDSKMRYMASDCIYECEMDMSKLTKDSSSKRKVPPIRFVFLLEGKSGAPSEPIDFQIEDYRKAVWSRDLRNKQFPGLVLPIIIYSGERKWNKRIMYDKFKPFLPIDLLEYIPFYKYLVINLHDMTDQEIIDNVDLGALRSAFLALKHGHNPNYFKKEIVNLFNFALEDKDLAADSTDSEAKYLLHEFLKLLSAYIQRRAKMSEQEIIETVLKSKNQVMATKVRTMFDIVEERGIEKGIAIGEAKSEDRIKQAEAKVKEVEEKAKAKVKETEAKAKETEAKAKETEAKAKETEAKAKETEAKMSAMIKILMLTTPMTDAQFVQQFKLSEDFVVTIRKEIVL